MSVRAWSAAERRALLLLLAAAVAVRLVCWQGIGYLDSLNYAWSSSQIAEHGASWGLGFHQNNRLGMTLPPALVMSVFGRSEGAAVAWFSVLSLAELVLVPLLLARVLSARTTLVATALYALMPAAIRYATHNSADMAMSVWTNAALLLLVTASAPRRAAACALAGLLFGIGCLHKETALVLLPVAAPFALTAGGARGRERVVALLAFGAGMAVPLAAEALVFHAWTGEAFYRYVHAESTHGGTLDAMQAAGPFDHYLKYWPANLLRSPSEMGTLVFLLPSVLAVHASDRFRTSGWKWAWWFAFAAGYAIFGTSSRTAWKPLLPYVRYIHYALLPAAVLAAQVLSGDVTWPRPRVVRVVAFAAALLLGAAAMTLRTRGWESGVAAAVAVVALALAAGRAPAGLLLTAVVLVPMTMAVERAAGRTFPILDPERRALAAAHDLGARELRVAGTARGAMLVLVELGEFADMRILPAPPAEIPALPAGTLVVVPGRVLAALPAERLEVVARFVGPHLGDDGTDPSGVVLTRVR